MLQGLIFLHLRPPLPLVLDVTPSFTSVAIIAITIVSRLATIH